MDGTNNVTLVCPPHSHICLSKPSFRPIISICTKCRYVSTSVCCALQGVANHFDDIVTTVGSGGTAEGLAIANHLSKSGLK